MNKENSLYVHEIENSICQECGNKGDCIEFTINDNESSFILCKKCSGASLMDMLQITKKVEENYNKI